MKKKVTIWVVSVTQFAMSDKDLFNEAKTFPAKDEALDYYNTSKQWLINYATCPESEDGSFKGRQFQAKQWENERPETGNIFFSAERETSIPEEFFKGIIHLMKKEIETNVSLDLDVSDIKRIQIITSDDYNRNDKRIQIIED